MVALADLSWMESHMAVKIIKGDVRVKLAELPADYFDVEPVAKAIFNHMFAKHERGLWKSNDFLRNQYLDCARAAIKAMPKRSAVK
jgi:hypothetical protein